MTASERHRPVLLAEAIAWLNVRPEGVYADCTGGAGGHSAAIREKLRGGRLVVAERHAPTAARLAERFRGDDGVEVRATRFSLLFDNADEAYDGILADLGISSEELGDPALGIGFMLPEARLDMRLDDDLTTTAKDLLAESGREELIEMFRRLGGERRAGRIATAIVADRERGRLYETTGELRGLCERVLGRFYRRGGIHPATRVFQALRRAVNREEEELEGLLEKAPPRLKDGGRFVVISFHEGEDGPVKQRFRELAAGAGFTLPIRRAVKPLDAEIRENPRARSARLRVLERTDAE